MRSKISPDIWEQIRTAYASGIGLREIARNMGIPAGTVLSRAKREGWSQQIQSAKALVKREDTLAVTPVEAVAVTLAERGQRHLKRMAGVSERGVDHIETMDGHEILNSVDRSEKLDKVARRTFGLKDDNSSSHFTLNVTFSEHVRRDRRAELIFAARNQLQSADAIRTVLFAADVWNDCDSCAGESPLSTAFYTAEEFSAHFG